MNPELQAITNRLVKTRSKQELALGFARYEALRRLGPHQFTTLHKRNLAGETFDNMVDSMVVEIPL